ncbi:OmpH family outer membrane protein [Reinekea forsetii]|nr:OmpH family outer membrane protein [Reinekea forsetii]
MRIKHLVFTCFILLGAVFASAQNSIAVVNFQRVLFESEAAVAATNTLQPEIEAIKKQISEIETRVTALKDKLAIDGATLTEEERTFRQEEIQQLLINRSNAINAGQQKQTNSRNDFVNQYKNVVQQLINELAAERGYNLVVDMSTVVYIDGIANITEEAIARFDKLFQNNEITPLP